MSAIQKIDGMYRKPRLTAESKVPLLLWLPLLLVISSVLVLLSLKTQLINSQPVPIEQATRKKSWRIAVVGDIACNPDHVNFNGGSGIVDACQQKLVGEALERERVDAVLLLGDIQYPTGKFEDFERSIVPYFRDITVPIYSVVGNHDYGNGTVQAGDLSGYKKAYDIYMPQVTYQKGGLPYYNFNLGPWNFYALDSNCEYVDGCDDQSPQYEWLTRQVSGDSSVCSVGLWHHPVFTSGLHKDEPDVSRGRQFWKLLQESGADIVLNGHDHHYERISPKLANGTLTDEGMRGFIVGAGGYSLRKISKPYTSGQEKVVDDKFGYLYLELFPGRYEWKYKDVFGNILDSGLDSCR